MAFTTAKISELPLRNSLPLTYHSHSYSLNLLFSSASNLSFHILKPISSLRTNNNNNNNTTTATTTTQHGGNNSNSNSNPSPNPRSHSAPWLNKWPSPSPPPSTPINKLAQSDADDKTDRLESRYLVKDKGHSAIDRIVLRLRNLGIGSDGEDEEGDELDEMDGAVAMPVTGEEKLGDLLQREWIRPDFVLAESERNQNEAVLPWEREEEMAEEENEGTRVLKKRRPAKAPNLAEMTIEDEELRRLRRTGMFIRERISVPKAGLTKEVLEKIHGKWRKEELVRLKFHEVLALNMRLAHELVEVGCLI